MVKKCLREKVKQRWFILKCMMYKDCKVKDMFRVNHLINIFITQTTIHNNLKKELHNMLEIVNMFRINNILNNLNKPIQHKLYTNHKLKQKIMFSPDLINFK